jgi:hypothetical protein
MAWGTAANVTTTHLNSASDDPSQARVELYNALVELTAVINGRNSASGVAGLNSSSKISASQLPNNIVSDTATDLTLTPATTRVNVEHILNLDPRTVSQLTAVASPQEGDVAYCSNGDGGSKCLAVYNGSAWKRIALGATIST